MIPGAVANSGLLAIVPEDAEGSELMARITAEDESLRMPPADSGKELKPAEVETLRRWVEVSWTALPPLRRWDPHRIRNLFFGTLCAYAAFGREIRRLRPDVLHSHSMKTDVLALPVALAEHGRIRRALGLDWDAGKIAAGQQAAADLGRVTLQAGDLRQAALEPCDVVTLVDVLHYYDAATQREVLARAAAVLRPGGLLLIRETDPAHRGGARLTRLIERAAVRLGWNRGPRVTYRPLDELAQDLRSLGLRVTQRELAATTHPGNVLVLARKPPPPEPTAP